MGRMVGRSVPPVWIDALDLRVEIDDETRKWQPDRPNTPARLRAVAARPWRPQDTSGIDKISCRVEGLGCHSAMPAHPGQREACLGAVPGLRGQVRVQT